MAETVDDSLYILYINDKDAGGAPRPEGVDTENPVMYYAVHRSVVLEEVGVNEDKAVEPATFALRQNYPNPFNASTTIEYVTRTPGKVDLAVYTGSAASGVYYYKLSNSEGTITKRGLLLK